MKSSDVFRSLKAFIEACNKDKKLMVICYADRAGNPILVYRMPDAWLGSLHIAQAKAFSAIAFSGPEEDAALPTADLQEMVQPGKPLYGLTDTNNGRIVAFGGGIPVYIEGKLRGSVGVSGSTVEDDVKYAEIAVAALLGSDTNSEDEEDDEDGNEDEDSTGN